MDSDADNFEPKAKTDCGCCNFAGKGLVWYQKAFYDQLKTANVTSLKYYANNEPAGEASRIPFYNISAPTVATNNTDYSFFQKKDGNVLVVNLGSAKSKKMEVRVTDQGGNELWKDSVTFRANKITVFEIN